jgi:NhaP-type Na+/H+ or K+/H+ antiporter
VSVIQLIAFPLLAIVLSPFIWRHPVVQTAVLAFVIAVVQYFVFIEPANVSANNFAWGMRIFVPLLYAAGLGILLRAMRTAQPPSLRLHVLGLVLTAHLLSGVLYLLQLLTTASYL